MKLDALAPAPPVDDEIVEELLEETDADS
jgi:hypothetical protein